MARSESIKDVDLEAGIVIYELSHGLSTLLTGGPMGKVRAPLVLKTVTSKTDSCVLNDALDL